MKNSAFCAGTGGLASHTSYFGLKRDICSSAFGGRLFDGDSSKKPYACVRNTANCSGSAYSGSSGPLTTTREPVSLNGLCGVPGRHQERFAGAHDSSLPLEKDTQCALSDGKVLGEGRVNVFGRSSGMGF